MKKKPQAPLDLWEQLAEHLKELHVTPPKPAGAFTRIEFQDKMKLTIAVANKTLARLRKSGKVVKFGWGAQTYYMLAPK